MDTSEQLTDEDENVSEKLSQIKGDAIGDTCYSERWVLRVLIRLSEMSDETWDSDLEQDLCLLWDMTTEKDVVKFLLANDFLDLFCKTVRVTNNARCLEMMVGVLGNMGCLEEGRLALAEHNASLVVVNLITSEDSLILIQVLRLLNSCLFSYRVEDPSTRPSTPTNNSPSDADVPNPEESVTNLDDDSPSSWLTIVSPNKDLLIRHLGFFLSSATNEELLHWTLELLDTLLSIPALQLTAVVSTSVELSSGLPECLRQLLRTAKVGDSVTENRRLWRALQVWMTIIGYVGSSQQGRVNLACSGDLLTKCFTKLVILLTTPEALRTQDPDMATLCLCVLETLPGIRVSAPVLSRLTKVLFELEQGIADLNRSTEEDLEVINLLHRGSHFIKQRLEESESDDLVRILQSLDSHCQSFLLSLASEDPQLTSALERTLLHIKTSGLVQ